MVVLDHFATYEDYLDSQVTDRDLHYLEDEDLARRVVELGYRGGGDTLKREEFEARKMANVQKVEEQKPLAGAKRDLSDKPFLFALASRERLVRSGKLTSIIFIRDRNAKGQEVSAYIDYAHRLKMENFEPYYEGKKKLMPKPTDLSYYNWETKTNTSNPTQAIQIITDNESGLLFKNKRDRKVINPDPQQSPGDNSTRTEVRTNGEYMQVVIYDHMTRRNG